LAIDVSEQIVDPGADVALDLRPLGIDCAKNGKARERNERQHRHERQQREARLNTQGMTAPKGPHYNSEPQGPSTRGHLHGTPGGRPSSTASELALGAATVGASSQPRNRQIHVPAASISMRSAL